MIMAKQYVTEWASVDIRVRRCEDDYLLDVRVNIEGCNMNYRLTLDERQAHELSEIWLDSSQLQNSVEHPK